MQPAGERGTGWSPVRLDRHGDVAVVTMSNPARRNALCPAMIAGLADALSASIDARAVILRAGVDDRVWSAGFDIGELAAGIDPLAPGQALSRLFGAVATHPAAVIAMLRGSTWGGGADLVLRCDMVVAEPDATLAFTPARLGLPYDADGLLNVLLRAGPAVAAEMFMTGDPVGAERAHELGLVNRVVPVVDLEDWTMALAARIAGNAPLSVRSAKQHIRALAAALPLAPAVAAALAESRRVALASEDYAAGIAAFHARVRPDFRGR